MNWESKEDGFLAQSINNEYVVTGDAAKYTDDYTWELWGYNYENYTADHIRLILKGGLLNALQNEQMDVLVYEQGEIKNVKNLFE